MGARVCRSDGTGLGACACPGDDAGPPLDSTASVDVPATPDGLLPVDATDVQATTEVGTDLGGADVPIATPDVVPAMDVPVAMPDVVPAMDVPAGCPAGMATIPGGMFLMGDPDVGRRALAAGARSAAGSALLHRPDRGHRRRLRNVPCRGVHYPQPGGSLHRGGGGSREPPGELCRLVTGPRVLPVAWG